MLQFRQYINDKTWHNLKDLDLSRNNLKDEGIIELANGLLDRFNH